MPSFFPRRSLASWGAPLPCAGRAPAALVALALLAFAAFAGCATPPRYEGQVYTGGGLQFRVGPEPAGWSRIQTNHGLLAFRSEEEHATVLVNGRCGQDGDDVPLAALTAHLFLQFTERAVEEEETLPFDGREARRTVLQAKLDGVPRRLEVVVTKKDGCVYDFVLITPPEAFAAARPGFDRFVAGFHVDPR
jgi:hypothetical protein